MGGNGKEVSDGGHAARFSRAGVRDEFANDTIENGYIEGFRLPLGEPIRRFGRRVMGFFRRRRKDEGPKDTGGA